MTATFSSTISLPTPPLKQAKLYINGQWRSASDGKTRPTISPINETAIAAWEPQSKDDEQRHIQWSQNLSQALAPYAFKAGYVNSLDEQEQERVPLAFGPNYERLLDLKRKYDPDDVFRSTIGHLAPQPLSIPESSVFSNVLQHNR